MGFIPHYGLELGAQRDKLHKHKINQVHGLEEYKIMKSSGIGGQAVLEGVMMRNKGRLAVAVRKANGEIDIMKGKCSNPEERALFFRMPLVRGIVAFVDSLVIGMQTLTYSASVLEEEEQEDKKKRKKNKKMGIEEETPAPKNKAREGVEMAFTVLLSILLAVAVFVILPFGLSLLLNNRIHSQTWLAVIEGVIRVLLFVSYVYAISFMSDIRRVFMYHGAEHKTINCVENGLELNVANVRKQTRQHRRCGTSFLFVVMLLSILCFMFLHFENMWLRLGSRILLVPVVAGISYEFIRIAGNSDAKIIKFLSAPGMWLQGLTTREPDDDMIQVAIASVEAVFDWREYQARRSAMSKGMKRKRIKEETMDLTDVKKEVKAKERESKPLTQQEEELRQRELENARRADERARRMEERERRHAELEKRSDDAVKRHAFREDTMKIDTEAVRQALREDDLSNLDRFFDESITNMVRETRPSVDDVNPEENMFARKSRFGKNNRQDKNEEPQDVVTQESFEQRRAKGNTLGQPKVVKRPGEEAKETKEEPTKVEGGFEIFDVEEPTKEETEVPTLDMIDVDDDKDKESNVAEDNTEVSEAADEKKTSEVQDATNEEETEEVTDQDEESPEVTEETTESDKEEEDDK